MRSAFEATLILSLSVVVTLLVMAVVFPVHALGGGEQVLDAPDIQPAVFVRGIHDRPGSTDSGSAPHFDGQTPNLVCPYLAARAAAARCPALKGTDVVSACPYLAQQDDEERGTLDPPAAGDRPLDI